MVHNRRFILLGAFWFVSCGDNVPPKNPNYDVLCPLAGSHCTNADGPLQVGIAVRDITPVITETFRDCGLDNLCPGDPGYPGSDQYERNAKFDVHPTIVDGFEPVNDSNGNGFFDAVWMCGFNNARAATGIHDPLTARAIALRKGDTTFVLVVLDLTSYPYDEVERIRRRLPASLGVDLLLVGSTHTHSAPDTVGLWGFDEGSGGVDPAYMGLIQNRVIEAVTEAIGNLAEANVAAATGEVGGHPLASVTRGLANVIFDSRDPVVIDPEMRVLHFTRRDNNAPIGTLVNWQSHPESLCGSNTYISSDYVHYLRLAVENGVHRGGVDIEGLGGTTIYINGDLGGMQSPGHVRPIDVDGTQYTTVCTYVTGVDDPFFLRTRALGDLVGLDALRIIRTSPSNLIDPPMSFATKIFRLPVHNVAFQATFLAGVFYGRHIYDVDFSKQLTESNLPYIQTEVAVWNLGPVQAITIPGELHPELFLGGYGGEYTGPEQQLLDAWQNQEPPTYTVCDKTLDCVGAPMAQGNVCTASECICLDNLCRNKNYDPTDFENAPKGPYLRDYMTRPIKMLFGLTPDHVGYILPAFDFVLSPTVPYVEEAAGSHYEETRSLGANTAEDISKRLIPLLSLVP